jgi:hypothetical protein
VAEEEEQVQQQLGQLRAPHGETHQHLLLLACLVCLLLLQWLLLLQASSSWRGL